MLSVSDCFLLIGIYDVNEFEKSELFVRDDFHTVEDVIKSRHPV